MMTRLKGRLSLGSSSSFPAGPLFCLLSVSVFWRPASWTGGLEDPGQPFFFCVVLWLVVWAMLLCWPCWPRLELACPTTGTLETGEEETTEGHGKKGGGGGKCASEEYIAFTRSLSSS